MDKKRRMALTTRVMCSVNKEQEEIIFCSPTRVVLRNSPLPFSMGWSQEGLERH